MVIVIHICMNSKKIHSLLQACENFSKLAEWDLSKVVKTYKPQLMNEVAAGIRSINYLVTTNKDAAKATSLRVLDDTFGNIGEIVNRLDFNDTRGLDISLRDMRSIVGTGMFYTSSYNAGTGFDPITRLGGNDSPAAHLNNIWKIIEKMEGYFKYNTVIAPRKSE